MAVVGDEQVRMTVVIEIAHAGGLRPTGARQSGLLTHFGKVTLAIVAVELRASRRSVGVERGSVRNENVVGPVSVVVEDGGAGAGAFENEVLLFLAAEGVGNGQARLGCNIDEADFGGVGRQQKGNQGKRSGGKAKPHSTGPSC